MRPVSCLLRSVLIGSSLLFAAAVASADGGSMAYQATFTGTATPTGVDSNRDGLAASKNDSQGRSNFGPITTQSWAELLPWDGTTRCGPTHVVLQYRFFEAAQTFADGSRLFSSLISGTLCLDFTTGESEADIDTTVVGGTGRFAGATGQYSTHAQVDHAFQNGMTAFSGTSTGTVTLR